MAENLTRTEVLDLTIQALYEAADEDASDRRWPDPIRGIYPMMATITADGFVEVPDAEVAERFAALIERKRQQAGSVEHLAPSTSSDARSPRSAPGGRPRRWLVLSTSHLSR